MILVIMVSNTKFKEADYNLKNGKRDQTIFSWSR